MSNYDYASFIRSKLSRRDLLEQLAEECCELGHAALKLIRAEGLTKNITPKTVEEARQNLEEEMMDVSILLYLLDFHLFWLLVNESPKWQRWAERLGYTEETSLDN